MATGIRGEAARGGTEQRGILWEKFAGTIAAADPQRVWRFGIPSERAFAAIDFEPQPGFAAGADLRDSHHAAKIVFEMQKDGGIVIGGNGDIVEFGIGGLLKSFHAAAGR